MCLIYNLCALLVLLVNHKKDVFCTYVTVKGPPYVRVGYMRYAVQVATETEKTTYNQEQEKLDRIKQ